MTTLVVRGEWFVILRFCAADCRCSCSLADAGVADRKSRVEKRYEWVAVSAEELRGTVSAVC